MKTFSSKIWLNFKYFLYYALWESKLQGSWALVKGNLLKWLLFNEYLSLADCRFLCLCGISCSSAPSKPSVSWSKQGSAWVLHVLALMASCIIIFTILQVSCLNCLLNVNCEQACTMCTEVMKTMRGPRIYLVCWSVFRNSQSFFHPDMAMHLTWALGLLISPDSEFLKLQPASFTAFPGSYRHISIDFTNIMHSIWHKDNKNYWDLKAGVCPS